MAKDLHKEPFDDGTKIKLKIYREYLQEWLPVFLVKGNVIWANVSLYDFFAGQGKDLNGELGSPLITINEVNSFQEQISKKQINVSLVFNEFVKKKYNALKTELTPLMENNSCTITLENEDFLAVFNKHYTTMKKGANLLFLDQNGIKQITPDVFAKIISLKQTDFLFFISSSFIKRFCELDEFKKYLTISKTAIEGKDYYHIHRIVLDYYRSLVPTGKKYFLAPFSIKKGGNIYGLIFGTGHTLGIEKFLQVCWRIDPQTGESNYDIDRENIDLSAPTLFPEYNIPQKRQVFEEELQQHILKGNLKTDKDVYLFTLNRGFLPRDANPILKTLRGNKQISFTFKPITENIHKITIPGEIVLL
jgi:three-Cys-motif partner protein